MINIDCLKESIYKNDYFSESTGSLTIHNEDHLEADCLLGVEIRSGGSFICLNNKILKEASKIYQTEDRDAGRISFRRDCDGICLLTVNGRSILLIIEVKSGFNEVKKKGFEQLVASYVKIRSILQSIDGYNPVDYEEIGLLISYPPSGKTAQSKTSMIELKAEMIAPSALDRLNAENCTKLRVDHEVTLDLRDYNVDACHIDPSLYNTTLLVKHVCVTDRAASEIIDLDAYL